MKLVLIVETPNDDRLHHPLIAEALHRYTHRVKANNSSAFHAIDDLGLTGGPNTAEFVLHDMTRVKVTEFRCDREYLVMTAYDKLPRWLRWSIAWMLPKVDGDLVVRFVPKQSLSEADAHWPVPREPR